jgi:uncharacterized Zn-binding protein involved in type VI secretion
MPSHILVNGLGLTYKGTVGISMATIPDVCKTPTPGGPVPIPYPNIAEQSSLDKGTTTVFAKGKMIAIKGSQYSRSNGDEPGTAGGVKSNVNMKATDWITYSFDVKMDGKNACRHTDKKFHNNQNTVDLGGNIDPATGKPWHKCGEVGTYGSLCNNGKAAKPKFERDHVPAKATLFARARRQKKFKTLTPDQQDCVYGKLEARGLAIVIPKTAHRGHSPTCGSRNKPLIKSDAKTPQSMKAAARRDTKAIQTHLNKKASNGTKKDKDCAAAYRKAAKIIKAHDTEKMIKRAINECATT